MCGLFTWKAAGCAVLVCSQRLETFTHKSLFQLGRRNKLVIHPLPITHRHATAGYRIALTSLINRDHRLLLGVWGDNDFQLRVAFI